MNAQEIALNLFEWQTLLTEEIDFVQLLLATIGFRSAEHFSDLRGRNVWEHAYCGACQLHLSFAVVKLSEQY